MLDVAIVGAGPAGLSAAYGLGDRDVAVFERESVVGGRSRTVLIDDEPVNLGALFVYLGTETERLCEELGVAFRPVEPSTYSCHYKGVTVTAPNDRELVAGLPMSDEGKADLTKLLRELSSVYGQYASHGLAPASKELARITFAQFLGNRHPEVALFLRTACVGASTAWPEELSAQYGMRYVTSYLVRDPDHRGYIPGGMNEITRALERKLPGVIQFETEVRSMNPGIERGYRLRISQGGRRKTVEARRVVVAVPGPQVQALVPTLPDWKRQAIDAIPTATTVVVGVVLETTPDSSWDNVFFMPTIGTGFQCVFQAKVGPAWRPLENGKTVLYLYAHRQPAEAIFDRDETAITQEWLNDLYRVFPDARSRVVGARLTKWPHCFAYIRADRLEALTRAEEPVDGIHFAGDYASATAATHGAFAAGHRVAQEIAAPAAAARG